MSDVLNGASGGDRPWLAALLSFLYPGLGHLYLRSWFRAIAWFLLALGSAVLLVPPDIAMSAFSFDAVLRASEQIPLEATLTMFAVTILSMLDAYWVALRRRRRTAARGGTQTPAQDQPDADAASAQCPECGRELEEDLDFCHWCTAELDRSE